MYTVPDSTYVVSEDMRLFGTYGPVLCRRDYGISARSVKVDVGIKHKECYTKSRQ